MRIATWNVWGLSGEWQRRHTAIEDALHHVSPDVVGLQETWQVGDQAQADRLAAHLDLPHATHHGSSHDGDCSDGLALLSRWPICDRFSIQLPSLGRDDRGRWALGGTIRHPAGAFRAIVTHLAWRLDDGWLRRAQLDAIVAYVSRQQRLESPTVLVGDLNAPPHADEIRRLTGKSAVGDRQTVFRDSWEVAGSGPGHTWSPDNPHVAAEHDPPGRIDYVLVEWRPDEPGRVHAAAVFGAEPVDGVFPSDHFGVAADIAIGPVA